MERSREKSASPVRTVSFNDTAKKSSSPQRYPGRHNIFTKHHGPEAEKLDRHQQMDDMTLAFKKALSTTEITGVKKKKKEEKEEEKEDSSELEEEAEEEEESDEEEEGDEEEEEEEEGQSVVEYFLANMWERQEMCDLIIKVGKREVLAHKISLAAYSAQFTEQCIAEVPTGPCEIAVTDTNVDAIQEILTYIYTGDIELDKHNLDAVISASRQLGVTDVIDLGREFLLEYTKYTVLDHMWIAEKFEFFDICSSLFDYVCKYFVYVSGTESFMKSPVDKVIRLLQDDNLNVKRELDVYKIATKWIDFNRKGRKKHTKAVLNTIRFPLIVPDDVVKHVEPNMKHYSDECNKMLIDVFRFHALRYSGGATEDFLPKQRRYHPIKYIEKDTGIGIANTDDEDDESDSDEDSDIEETDSDEEQQSSSNEEEEEEEEEEECD